MEDRLNGMRAFAQVVEAKGFSVTRYPLPARVRGDRDQSAKRGEGVPVAPAGRRAVTSVCCSRTEACPQ